MLSEGRPRCVGVTHHDLPSFPALAQWVEMAMSTLFKCTTRSTHGLRRSGSSPQRPNAAPLSSKGPLPDKEMRARIVRHMETLPGFDTLAELPWSSRKQFKAVINRAQSQREPDSN